MKKRFDIAGITHPLVDVVVHCEPSFIASLGVREGSWSRSSIDQQTRLLEALGALPKEISTGASLANSVAIAAILGQSGLVFGLAGDDEYGQLFSQSLQALGVRSGNDLVPGARTGTCISLVNSVTGERTMSTCHGVAADFGSSHATEELIAASDWLMLEGYFVYTSEQNFEGLQAAVQVAKATGTRIAFSTAAEFVVQQKRDEILKLLPSLDLLFANETEALVLSGAGSVRDAFAWVCNHVPAAVVTMGGDGALGLVDGQPFEVPAFPAQVVDTTGAGDAFAGGFLAGLCSGLSPEISARGASRLAAEVVSQKGARLGQTAVSLWNQATGAYR